ncbi:hypothetical protein L7F22_043925 [Adiantum nelumboides]|nr:hypothetical protein [Adiantum nelumboides]
MQIFALLLLAIAAVTGFFSITEAADTAKKPSSGLVYPKAKRIDKKWSFRSAKANGNVTYDDPYFYFEGPTNDTSVQKFISDQASLTDSYMKRCSNIKTIQQSIQRSTDYDQYDEMGLFAEQSGNPFYLFTLKHIGEQRPTWYKASVAEFEAGKKNNFAQPPGKPFLNESLLSADGSSNIISQGVNISPDGKWFCYLVSENNSDFATWYFRSVNTPLISAKTFPKGGEGSLSLAIPLNQQDLKWTHDSKGFFYVRAEAEGDQASNFLLKYHSWGTTIDKDITVVKPMTVELQMGMSYDGRWLYLLGFVDQSFKQFAYACLLDGQTVSEKMKWISISPDYDYQVYYVTTIKNAFYFQTDQGNATNSKIAKVQLDWSKARPTSILTDIKDHLEVQDVIKEREDALIPQVNAFAFAHDKLLINYIESGKDTLYLYDIKTGKMLQHLLPTETASFGKLIVYAESNKAVVSYTSWNTPTKIYELEYSKSTGQVQTSTVTIQNVRGTKASDFNIEQFFAISKDGTKVPYFVTQKGKGKECRPTWVQGYGAYGYKESLYYSPTFFTFLNNYNSRFVWTAIRGGSDEGGKWHLDATTIHKQRTYDDWIAILEDLKKRKLSCPGQTIIDGASAGAMAALVVANQAPQGLVNVVLAVRAVADYFMVALRSRIGSLQFSEFGNPNIPAEYDAIRAWSPLQNVDPKKEYPAMLLTPGQDDDRVSPAHSYKMIAELQYLHPNNKLPLLMYVAPGSGHTFAGSSTEGATLEAAHQFCLIEQALGIRSSKN